LRPNTAHFDEAGGIPVSVIRELGERGYLGVSIPREFGGLGMDPVQFGLFLEQIGKACCTVRTLLTVHTSIVGQVLLRWGTTRQKDRWLPGLASGKQIAAFALSESGAGSDARSVRTKYRREGDTYILNGKKRWISFGSKADVLLLIAASQTGGITAFLVETKTPGVTAIPCEGMSVGRGTYIADIELDEAEVPAGSVIGVDGSGFDYVVNFALDHGRYSVAWAGAALAGEALDAMVSYAHSRRQLGRKIAEFQLVQRMIANAIAETQAARALCLRAGELRRDGDPGAMIATSIAKYYSSGAAVRVAGDAVQVHGANGFSSEYPVERLYREAKALEMIEGSSEIQQQMIAEYGSEGYCKSYYKYKER
jgi:hypothetical protein